MAKIERIYNVPLRRSFQKVARDKKSKKAVKALKEFVIKHMKSEQVKIGPKANEYIWDRGIQKPPHHVKIKVVKENDVVLAELPEFFDDFYKLIASKKGEKKEAKKEEEKEKVIAETNDEKLKEEVEKTEEKIGNLREKSIQQ